MHIMYVYTALKHIYTHIPHAHSSRSVSRKRLVVVLICLFLCHVPKYHLGNAWPVYVYMYVCTYAFCI